MEKETQGYMREKEDGEVDTWEDERRGSDRGGAQVKKRGVGEGEGDAGGKERERERGTQ